MYDEYIDRRKLTEQESPIEYTVPKVGRNNKTKIIKNKMCLEKNCAQRRRYWSQASPKMFTKT